MAYPAGYKVTVNGYSRKMINTFLKDMFILPEIIFIRLPIALFYDAADYFKDWCVEIFQKISINEKY